MDNSVLIYEGPSPCGHQDIIVIASGLKNGSTNDKTGNMVQIYILLRNVHPLEAIKQGLDKAICGDCPLRGNGCYVNVAFAASMLWKTYQKGKIKKIAYTLRHVVDGAPWELITLLQKKSIPIRFGAYGDPAMIPYSIVTALLDYLKGNNIGHTSYTHQWMEPWFDERHLEYSMASVDHTNTVEKLRAIHPNARYYRIAQEGETQLASDEIWCPSDKNDRVDGKGSPRKVVCASCRLCSGTSKQAKNIVIREE